MTNTIVSIGCLGMTRCFLNVSREEAIKRYLATEFPDEPEAELPSYVSINTVTITDEWWSYDGAWTP
jgi:hypothetical protein